MQLARPARATFTATDEDEPGEGLSNHPAPGEAELVALAQHDIDAFAPLYERYVQPVHLYCLRRLGNRDDAADATSLVFTRALTGIRRFRPDPSRPGSTFRAWLFTIARNVVLDRYRRARPHVSLDTPDEVWHIADPGKSPEDLALHAEGARTVSGLLADLPDRQRAVVELRLAGLTIAEIATALDMTESAAKSLQVRAYRTLREIVGSSPASPLEHQP
jgi:RNA polymerase sigma-70 factor (ECF subfamily)